MQPQPTVYIEPAAAAASAAAGTVTAVAATREELAATPTWRVARQSATLCQVWRIFTGILSWRAVRRYGIVYDQHASVLLRGRLHVVWRLLCRPRPMLPYARGGARACC